MPHRKNTIKTDEVGSFFKKSTKEAMRANPRGHKGDFNQKPY